MDRLLIAKNFMITVLSVSQFMEQINGIIAGEFVVEGEISSYKVSQGKWVFFDLKDDRAVLNCFAVFHVLGQPLEDGMKVRVIGYPKINEKNGRFSLTVQRLELVGEGTLKKAYLLLKKKLEEEGLFSVERKRPLPEFPQRIGVIASRDSAAFGDFKRILNNRWGGVEVNLYNTAVQGDSAVGEIVSAFNYFNHHPDLAEVLVLIRGGGSLEDLAAFNSEEVVRAVYGSKIPVICGVGHERDESLADFAADVRASTPSNAAEIVVPSRSDFVSQLDFGLENISGVLEHLLTKKRHLLEEKLLAISGHFEAPLYNCRQMIDRFTARLLWLESGLVNKQDFVLGAERFLKSVDPRQVLRRGFSIVRDSRGKILRRANQVDAGDEIMIELSEGSIGAQVAGKGKKPAQTRLSF